MRRPTKRQSVLSPLLKYNNRIGERNTRKSLQSCSPATAARLLFALRRDICVVRSRNARDTLDSSVAAITSRNSS